MNAKLQAGFGDNVAIRSTEDTRAAGYAGLRGVVYGLTTPSVTGVEVIGEPVDDRALNVRFDDLGKDAWFATHLVELIDYNPGMEIRLEGVPVRWVRAADGSWLEESTLESGPAPPWWKFWKRR